MDSEYKSQAARDAQQGGYGDAGYWAYLDEQAEEQYRYWMAKSDPVQAQEMMTRSLSDALRGNDGD